MKKILRGIVLFIFVGVLATSGYLLGKNKEQVEQWWNINNPFTSQEPSSEEPSSEDPSSEEPSEEVPALGRHRLGKIGEANGITLTVTVAPVDADNKAVTWSTSNAALTVTPLTATTAKVYATAMFMAPIDVTVASVENPTITAVAKFYWDMTNVIFGANVFIESNPTFGDQIDVGDTVPVYKNAQIDVWDNNENWPIGTETGAQEIVFASHDGITYEATSANFRFDTTFLTYNATYHNFTAIKSGTTTLYIDFINSSYQSIGGSNIIYTFSFNLSITQPVSGLTLGGNSYAI